MAPGLGGGIQGAASLGIILALVSVISALLVNIGNMPPLSIKAIQHKLAKNIRGGLILGILVGAFTSFILSPSKGLHYGLYRGIGIGVSSAIIMSVTSIIISLILYEQDTILNISKDDFYFRKISDRFLNILLFGVCGALGFGLIYALQEHQIDQLVINYSLIGGFFFGIAYGLAIGTDVLPNLGNKIQSVESVTWSGSSAVKNLIENLRKNGVFGIVLTLCAVITIGITSSFAYGLNYGLRYGLVYGLLVGLISSTAAILATILTSGWKSSNIDENQLTKPNEGIRRSILNAGFAACIFGPIGGLISGLIAGIAFGLVGGIAEWPILLMGFVVIFSVIFAFEFFTIHGGIAFCEHYILRYHLHRRKYMPWKYSDFLDYAAECIILYKVGGGYIFSHRLLLEYFANLPPESKN